MEISLTAEQTTHQSITAHMIEAIQILSLSTVELDQRIQAELANNPALDLEDAIICPRCWATLDGTYCPTCRLDTRSSGQASDDDEPGLVEAPPVDGDFDPMTLIASDVSLVDQILAEIATMLDACDLPVAEYVVNCLDHRGFLDTTVDDIAAQVVRPVADVERILTVVQAVAPPGMAARSVGECLLLQLDHLTRQADVVIPAIAQPIIANYLGDLAGRHYSRIAGALGVDVASVVAAHEFIRTHLNPCPMQSTDVRTWKAPVQTPCVAPDVIVHTIESSAPFQIEVVESRLARIRLDPEFLRLAVSPDRGAGAATPDERVRLRSQVHRARFFLSALQQRQETLRRITSCLMEEQHEFVVRGVRELRPMTRSMVAERIGVHESTVSRATAGKYIMLPNRQVIPFSTFFTASLSTMDVIKDLIKTERVALTDEQICRRLKQDGIRIARRTVAKYRAALGILPSTMR